MPLQRRVEREPWPMNRSQVVTEQADVELGPSSCAAGKSSSPSRRAARATAIESMLSDLPRSRPPRRTLAVGVVEPAGRVRRARSSAAPRSPTRAGNLPAPRRARRAGRAQISNAAQPRAPTWTVLSPTDRPSPPRRRRSSCRGAPRARSLNRPPFHLDRGGRPADMACWGRCHAPLKSRRTSRPATSDTTDRSQARPSPDRLERSARRPVETLCWRRTSPYDPNRNSKPRSSTCGRRRVHQWKSWPDVYGGCPQGQADEGLFEPVRRSLVEVVVIGRYGPEARGSLAFVRLGRAGQLPVREAWTAVLRKLR